MVDTDRIVLWGCATPRTLRAHWALHELGLDYHCEPIQPRAGGAPNETFTKLNPRGKVPVLQHGDFTLTESAAIVNYLYATYGPPDAPAAASDPRSRARYDAWCFFLMTELDATSLYVLRRHVGLAHVYGDAPAAVEAAKVYFLKQVQAVSDTLADGRPWLMGETFSGADILLTSCFAMALPHGLPLTDTLAAYRDRAIARPAHVAALEANRPEHWSIR
ncbi:glutathione S-transferase family protein [Roseomonas sp. HF4]|uniref:glutathione S-transferase family protein n=1 Tax=Roseomonas sp. HF4 TaxID=2562313 RepID=UPI0010C1291F|nr:glutathione S-transferase family protein [Roseomonas sp. HF4]